MARTAQGRGAAAAALLALSLLAAEVLGEGIRFDEVEAVEGASQTAVFSAGCFWSVELVFQRAYGVLGTSVGYVGGHTRAPTYKDITTGTTGHAEAVAVEFDPAAISFTTLLELLFSIHDPTTKDRQGNDRGTQYRSGIFYTNLRQRDAAQQYIQEINAKYAPRAIATEVAAVGVYWKAEEYHQQYLEKMGKNAAKGSVEPIQCYGNYGPVKDLDQPHIAAILRGGSSQQHTEL